MRNSRSDVVAAALRVLDAHGLEFCSMRRVAAELDVQPSALYHHVPNKQALLALMADEITRPVVAASGSAPHAESASSGPVSAGSVFSGSSEPGSFAGDDSGSRTEPRSAASLDGAARARALCRSLREAMLAVRDGADVVATASAYRLGASRVETELADLVGSDGARTLLLFTFGHAQSTQTQRQAIEFGALVGVVPGATDGAGADASADPAAPEAGLDGLEASYERGLDIILAGLAGPADLTGAPGVADPVGTSGLANPAGLTGLANPAGLASQVFAGSPIPEPPPGPRHHRVRNLLN